MVENAQEIANAMMDDHESKGFNKPMQEWKAEQNAGSHGCQPNQGSSSTQSDGNGHHSRSKGDQGWRSESDQYDRRNSGDRHQSMDNRGKSKKCYKTHTKNREEREGWAGRGGIPTRSLGPLRGC